MRSARPTYSDECQCRSILTPATGKTERYRSWKKIHLLRSKFSDSYPDKSWTGIIHWLKHSIVWWRLYHLTVWVWIEIAKPKFLQYLCLYTLLSSRDKSVILFLLWSVIICQNAFIYIWKFSPTFYILHNIHFI